MDLGSSMAAAASTEVAVTVAADTVVAATAAGTAAVATVDSRAGPNRSALKPCDGSLRVLAALRIAQTATYSLSHVIS